MRQSQLFTKTLKESPKDEMAKNAELLIRAGFIYKEMAGVYAYLPFGIRVLEKIKQIVREEMNAIGGQEIIMTTLQRKELWEKTNRWDDKKVDVWFKSQLKNGTDVGFGWSHEEPITNMMRTYLSSYRDLPAYVYQFQTKLRNELRAKSGIMRGREFVMKDMYSYSLDEETHQKFYDGTKDAYMRIFERIGLGQDTYITFASGGAFTQFSHEFQTITNAGEDTIFINREKHIAINEEVINNKILKELNITKEELEKVKTAEVGNIFNFGTSKCEKLGLYVAGKDGKKTPVFLGSYGIGITRLMGVIVERFADDKGIVWPESVAPFDVHLVSLCRETTDITKVDMLYKQLCAEGIDVLYDDRDARVGEKFADSDLIGIQTRIVVSPKTLGQGKVEVKKRTEDIVNLIDLNTIHTCINK